MKRTYIEPKMTPINVETNNNLMAASGLTLAPTGGVATQTGFAGTGNETSGNLAKTGFDLVWE